MAHEGPEELPVGFIRNVPIGLSVTCFDNPQKAMGPHGVYQSIHSMTWQLLPWFLVQFDTWTQTTPAQPLNPNRDLQKCVISKVCVPSLVAVGKLPSNHHHHPMAFIGVYSSCRFRDGFVHLCGRLPRSVAVATCIEAHFAAHDDVTSLSRIPWRKSTAPLGTFRNFACFGKVSSTAASRSLKKRESFKTFTIRSEVKASSLLVSSMAKGFLWMEGNCVPNAACRAYSVCAKAGSMIRFVGPLSYHNVYIEINVYMFVYV